MSANIFSRLPNKGFADTLEMHEISDLVAAYSLRAGKYKTLQIPMEPYIKMIITLKLTGNGKRIKVLEKIYTVGFGNMCQPFRDLQLAQQAVEPIKDIFYTQALGGF